MVDPNFRPGLWGSERAADLIRPLARRCDILIGGARELAVIADGADAEAIARACAAFDRRRVLFELDDDDQVVGAIATMF